MFPEEERARLAEEEKRKKKEEKLLAVERQKLENEVSGKKRRLIPLFYTDYFLLLSSDWPVVGCCGCRSDGYLSNLTVFLFILVVM